DAWLRPAARPAPRWPDDHRPQFRAVIDRPMTIQALADDVLALLDHLGIAQADLFGFSLGGLVAYAVARSLPTRRISTSSRPGRQPWCTSSRGGPTSCDHCRCRPC